jgi:zinc transport system ATP-binding protein
MPSDKIIFNLKDVSFQYGANWVLQKVNLQIVQGDYWFFLGINGSGKSTLLNGLIGSLSPQSGSIVRHPELAKQKKLGFIPQFNHLNPSLPTTVREVVGMGLVGLSIDRKEEKVRLDWALERVGMAGCARKNFWILSGGQKQRVFIARALIRMPAVILMDEPINNLDYPAEQEFLDCLERLREEEQMTFVFVSHDLHLAKERATHVGLFSEGSVLAGVKEGVLTKDNLQKAFKQTARLKDSTILQMVGKNGRKEGGLEE